MQDDRFEGTDSVTVCPFTSTVVDAPLLRLPITADRATASFLMIDKITAVRRADVRAVIGRLDATTVTEFERRLLVFLGFGA